jgi:5'-deoxynucleotidase YfbR-like HD superfamily hydrolase
MNYKKIDILLGMKDIQRLPNTPHHRGYNLLEHGLVVGMLFRWFASEEDVSYDINVWDKVLMHDYVESVTGDLNACVKKFNGKTAEAWDIIEHEICEGDSVLFPYSDRVIKESMTEMQYRLFKCCDYLDLWIFCKNEVALGNNTQKIHSVMKHCNELLEKYSDNWNYFKSIKKFTENYVG